MITYYLSSLENDNCCVNEIITSVLYCLFKGLYTNTVSPLNFLTGVKNML